MSDDRPLKTAKVAQRRAPLLAALFAAGIAPAHAAPGTGDGLSSLYADRKAHRVGDTVQVIVLESTRAESSAATGTGSSGDFRLAGHADRASATGSLALSGDARGNGQTSRAGSVRTVLTAQVTALTPEGHLVLEANQEVAVNDERQHVSVRGIAREADISAGNEIASNRLAQAVIRIDGSGPLAGAQRPGILFRFLKWVRLL